MRELFKFVFCFFLTCFISVYSSYSQEKSHYKCAYQFDFLSDTITMKYFHREIYIVQIGNNLTKGFICQKFYLDSLNKISSCLFHQMFTESLNKGMEEIRKTGEMKQMSHSGIHNGAFHSDLYKDYLKDEIRVKDNINTHSFIYKDEFKTQDWEILSDTVTIFGYYCQKAKCHWRGRDWEAWFTTEIPISEGPWKFCGLPGLITRINDSKKHYSFELIGFQKAEEPINSKVPEGIQKIERKEFVRMAFGKKGEFFSETEMPMLGLSDKESIKANYDYIELDYND